MDELNGYVFLTKVNLLHTLLYISGNYMEAFEHFNLTPRRCELNAFSATFVNDNDFLVTFLTLARPSLTDAYFI